MSTTVSPAASSTLDSTLSDSTLSDSTLSVSTLSDSILSAAPNPDTTPEAIMAARDTKSGSSTVPQDSGKPLGEQTIADMRVEIDAIDAELVRLILRRSEISHSIGAARASEGGTRIVYSREMKILDRFAVLGPAGTELGMLLLSLGRGRLGRR
ncbi:MAG: chorismate mutase [Nakamurella sp.]